MKKSIILICIILISISGKAFAVCDTTGCYGYRSEYLSPVSGNYQFCSNLYPTDSTGTDCNTENISFLNQEGYINPWQISSSNTDRILWSAQISGCKDGDCIYGMNLFKCCEIVEECEDGFIMDDNGQCISQQNPEPPPHPIDSDCQNAGGSTHRFYRTKINYKEIPPETLISFIISSFFGPQSCITYYKTSYWEICCDIETTPTSEDLNSGYMPEGCYTIRSDLHLQYGDPQAIHTDTYTTPWSEFDPAAEVGLSSEMCPWITGEHADTDGDGIPNYLDNDIDGDGIENRYDPDVDGDGILNGNDPDVDGDGVPNTIDIDIDGDFIPNHLDDDIDGDGLLNDDDPDADGDGIPNEEDGTPFGSVDEDGNGMPDDLENPDDINSDENQEDYNSSDFAITEDFLVGDDFDQYMEPEEIDVDVAELEALKDNYGMTLYNLNCQLHVTGDLGVVGTLDQTINFCPWEQSLIAIGYVLVAFSGLLCLFRTFS